jgi:hypothetical protein
VFFFCKWGNCARVDGIDADTMDTWDDEKLKNVVLSKAGNPRTTTDVCLSFVVPHSFS